MKNIFLVFTIFLFSSFQSLANDRNNELEKLFNDLKINDKEKSFLIEQKIWNIWSTHPYDKGLTLMLRTGSDLVSENKFYDAIDIFTKVIKLDPNWAEAWNKRATVYYIVGKFQKSQKDIDKVLKLEKRHFGALAGQGLVNIQLQNYEKAIKSYEKAQKIYPAMESPKTMIKEINELIKKQSI